MIHTPRSNFLTVFVFSSLIHSCHPNNFKYEYRFPISTCFEDFEIDVYLSVRHFRASFYGFHFIGFPKRSTFVASFVDPSNGYRSRNSITQVAWHFLLAFNDFFIWLQIKDDRAFNMKWLSNTFKSGWPIKRQTYTGRTIRKQICHQGSTNCVLWTNLFLCQIWYGTRVWNRLGIQRVRTLGILELYCFRL